MKNTEAKTATKFVKHLVTRLENEAKYMRGDLTLTLANLTDRIEKALQMLDPQNQVVDNALKDTSTTMGNGSGEVDPEDFVEAMFRMKNTEAKTATKFVKHLVTRLDHEARDMHADLTLTLAGLTERTEKALQMLEPQNQVVDKALKDTCTTKQIWAESLEQRFQERVPAVQRTIELAMKKASAVALEAAMAVATQVAKDVMAEVDAQSDQLAGGMLGRLKLATPSTRSWSTSDAGNLPDTAHLPDAVAHRRPDCSPTRPCGMPFFLQASGGGLALPHSSKGGPDVP